MANLPPIHPNQAPHTNTIVGIAVREDLLFTNYKGEEKPKLRKEAARALEELQGILPRLLDAQETVLYVTRATAPLSTVEQLTLGWYGYAMYSVVLVLTNRRLLRMRVRGKSFGGWTWLRGVMAASWGEVAEAKVKGWLSRTLLLKYRNGRKETYWRISSQAAKKMKLLLPVLLSAGAGETTTAQGMVSLCPDCCQVLQPRVYECGQCRLPFKDEKTLLWRNYLLPGGGYLYTGWGVPGVLHAIVDCLIILDIILFSLYALRVIAPPVPHPGEKPTTAESAAITVGFLVLFFLFENTIAWMHNRRLVRDFIPAR
jgi:hypothetical protein